MMHPMTTPPRRTITPAAWGPMGLALLLSVSACVKQETRLGNRRAEPTIRFSHAKHVRMKVPCGKCHVGIEDADRLSSKYNPRKKECKQCHEQVYKPGQCTMCHVGPGKPGGLSRTAPTPNLGFSHRAHAKRTKDCSTCHDSIMRSTTLAGFTRPKMRDCFKCHNHLADYRALRCGGCHKSLAQFPIKFVSAFRHEGNFLKEHGRRARPQTDLCRRCHMQSFCADCHSQRQVVVPSIKMMDRTDRQFIHRGDWLSRHPMEVGSKPGTCIRCHSAKQCEACHRKAGVAQRLTLKGKSISPHPRDWLNPMSPNNHGFSARRRITQCAACHDRGPQSNCVRCHRSVSRGGQGINPHPPGFDRGGKNRHPVCKLCH